MRVLDQKDLPTVEVTCSYCKSLLELNKLDIHETARPTSTGEFTKHGYVFPTYVNEFYVNCPVCRTVLKLDVETIKKLE